MLLSFDPADWGSADADAAFLEWQRARREFAAEYPGSSLGDILDLLRANVKRVGSTGATIPPIWGIVVMPACGCDFRIPGMG